MNKQDRELMEQALEALESCSEDEWYTEDDFGMMKTYDESKVVNSVAALRERLSESVAQPEPAISAGPITPAMMQGPTPEQKAQMVEAMGKLAPQPAPVAEPHKQQSAERVEPVAKCTESDSWNCKYCRKNKSCDALKDPRNFEQPPQQDQGMCGYDEATGNCTNNPCCFTSSPANANADQRSVKPWVWLKDSEILDALGLDGYDSFAIENARTIEAKLKEKNA